MYISGYVNGSFRGTRRYPASFLEDVLLFMDFLDYKGVSRKDLSRVLDRRRLKAGSNRVTKLETPCCGGSKIDKQVKAFREKQRRLKMERL